MFSVSVPTRVNSVVCDPRKDAASPRDVIVYTRRGRRFLSVEPARKLASKFLGRVTDVNTGRVVADYM